ncbi:hypothetical protein AB1303_01430 [Saccharolobus solfataricus]|uniref:hypothetical protein n=1 Tax=Saccharolobus solfataricus TaxID=2287 RepID=UPI0007B55C2C|nr:hypothetical protein [Saccharolobus solfataricus]
MSTLKGERVIFLLKKNKERTSFTTSESLIHVYLLLEEFGWIPKQGDSKVLKVKRKICYNLRFIG